MEQVFVFALSIVSILVLFGVISSKKVSKYVIWIILIFIFAPITYCLLRTKTTNFLSGSHYWWEYVIGFVIILFLLRIILNFIFPWRRR